MRLPAAIRIGLMPCFVIAASLAQAPEGDKAGTHAQQAEIAGASVPVPLGWTAVERLPNDFVQARFASPSHQEYLSLGSLVLPRTPLREFIAMGLRAFREGMDAESLASRAGLSKEEFLRVCNEHAGPEITGLLPDLGKSVRMTLLESEWTTVCSRQAFHMRVRIEVPSATVFHSQWTMEGYSLGELITLLVATRSDGDPLPANIVQELRILDSRVPMAGIPGFELKWPRGAFVVPSKEERPANKAGVVQIPLGPVGAVRVRWASGPTDPRTPIAAMLQEVDRQARKDPNARGLENPRSREWSRGALRLGSYDYSFHFTPEQGQDATMYSKVQFVQAPHAGVLRFVIDTPQEASDVAQRVLETIIDTVRCPQDEANALMGSQATEPTPPRNTRSVFVWASIGVSALLVSLATRRLIRRRNVR